LWPTTTAVDLGKPPYHPAGKEGSVTPEAARALLELKLAAGRMFEPREELSAKAREGNLTPRKTATGMVTSTWDAHWSCSIEGAFVVRAPERVPQSHQVIGRRGSGSAGGRCEYCHFPRHMPNCFPNGAYRRRQHGGADEKDNLALACCYCNRYKGPNLSGVDPARALSCALRPRRQSWPAHFVWNGVRLEGELRPGGLPVETLRLNRVMPWPSGIADGAEGFSRFEKPP